MGSIWTNSPNWPLSVQMSFQLAAISELEDPDLGDWSKDLPTGASYQMQQNRTWAPDLHLDLKRQQGHPGQ